MKLSVAFRFLIIPFTAYVNYINSEILFVLSWRNMFPTNTPQNTNIKINL